MPTVFQGQIWSPLFLESFRVGAASSAVVKWAKVAHPTNDGKGQHQNQTRRKSTTSLMRQKSEKLKNQLVALRALTGHSTIASLKKP